MIVEWLIMLVYVLLTIVVSVIAIVLFVPFCYRVHYVYKGKQDINIEASLGNIIGVQLHIEGLLDATLNGYLKVLGHKIRIDTKNTKAKVKNKKSDYVIDKAKTRDTHRKDKSIRIPTQEYFSLLNKELIENSLHCVIDLHTIVKPKVFKLEGKVGLSEPDQTAWFYAIIEILKGHSKHRTIKIEPVWDYEYYEIDAELAGRFTVAVIVLRIIRYLVSAPVRKLWKHWRKAKRKYSYSKT